MRSSSRSQRRLKGSRSSHEWPSLPWRRQLTSVRDLQSKHRGLLLQRLRLPPCYYCEKPGHAIEKCFSFEKLSPTERFAAAKKRHLCFKCLGKGHSRFCCRGRCETCRFAHHTLLHDPERGGKGGNYSRRNWRKRGVPVEAQVATATAAPRNATFGVLPVRIQAGGKEARVLALLDSGSTITLVNNIPIRHDRKIDCNQWPHLKELCLPSETGPVDLVIGVDCTYAFRTKKEVCAGRDDPVARQSPLVWIVFRVDVNTWSAVRQLCIAGPAAVSAREDVGGRLPGREKRRTSDVGWWQEGAGLHERHPAHGMREVPCRNSLEAGSWTHAAQPVHGRGTVADAKKEDFGGSQGGWVTPAR